MAHEPSAEGSGARSHKPPRVAAVRICAELGGLGLPLDQPLQLPWVLPDDTAVELPRQLPR